MKQLQILILLMILISCDIKETNKGSINQKDSIIETALKGDPREEDMLALKEMSHNSTSNGISDDSFAVSIDTYVLDCLDTNGTTTGMIDCYRLAVTRLDSLIDLKFKEIYSKLDKEDKSAFKTSHENWKIYFVSESDFLHGAFYTWANYSQYGHGREHSITQNQWIYQIARNRFIALSNYNDQLYTEEE